MRTISSQARKCQNWIKIQAQEGNSRVHPEMTNKRAPAKDAGYVHCAFNQNLSEESYNSGFLRIFV